MKTLFKITGIFILLITLGCGGSDDDGGGTPMIEDATIQGDWERSSGTFLGLELDYLLINTDNTVSVLSEDDLGFRDDISGNYAATDDQVTVDLSFFGSNIINYTVTETTLELRGSGGSTSTYTRIANAPTRDSWITKLTVLSQGNAPWDERADIAYNGTQILLGNGRESDGIGLINTETFALEGTIPTTEEAYAVEVEKLDLPDKYIFQSSNGSRRFKAYFENTNIEDFESIDLGSWLYGLASVDRHNIWATSGNEDTLYLLNYESIATQSVERAILLDRDLGGLDYQDGFLYICSNGNIYKCDVSSSFEILDTYSLEGYRAQGIAFDGTNFWINAASINGGSHQIIKTSLTL